MKTTSETLEQLFLALGDRTRIRLLSLMGTGEVCVCFLVEVLEVSQPKISRHLAYLRKAGLVSVRREGKWVHYGIEPPSHPLCRMVFDTLLGALQDDREMKGDRMRLIRACCSPRVPEQLRRAPRPAIGRGEER